jgi:plastocyanin
MKTKIVSKSRSFIGFAMMIAILSFATGCTKTMSNNYGTPPPGGSKGPGANEVFIQGLAFTPSSITVAAGTTITWTNKDGFAHTVTSDTGSSEVFNSGPISSNGIFTHTFSTAGTYNYHCSIHLSMTAKVIVN